MCPVLTDFSQSYLLMPEHGFESYTGDVVGADISVMQLLTNYTRQPLVKLGNSHYWLRSQGGIPGGTIAVPQEIDEPLTSQVLVAKEEASRDLLMQGHVDPKGRPQHGL